MRRPAVGQITGQPKLELFAESETAFFIKPVDAQLDFVAEGGAVTHLMLHQNGRDLKGVKNSARVPTVPGVPRGGAKGAQRCQGCSGHDLRTLGTLAQPHWPIGTLWHNRLGTLGTLYAPYELSS